MRLQKRTGRIRAFEKQLTDDKMVLIKLFLAIDQQEQKKRMKRLQKQKETAWRVEKGDLERNRRYEDYLSIAEELLRKTDSDDAPWTVIEATDERFAEVKIYRTVVAALEEAVRRAEKENLWQQEFYRSETSRQNGRFGANGELTRIDPCTSRSVETTGSERI